MIVLAGIPSEPPLRLVREAADQLGIDVVMLNQREAAAADLHLTRKQGRTKMVLHRAGNSVDLSCAGGVYTRLGGADVTPEYRRSGPSDARARIDAWHMILNAWLETTDIRVLNRIRPCNSNMSKPYQSRIIADCGLEVPKTLITNNPDRARAFQREHSGIIFKSISAHRSIVRRLEGGYAAKLDRIRALPVQFQEFIPGTDIRVHVIGDAVFATEISSDADDYRYAADEGAEADYRETTLPDPVLSACLRLSARLNLPLCGIDLRLDPAGRYVCFEVNPSPAYSCFEEQTGQPISRAIAVWLETGRTQSVELDNLRRVV